MSKSSHGVCMDCGEEDDLFQDPTHQAEWVCNDCMSDRAQDAPCESDHFHHGEY